MTEKNIGLMAMNLTISKSEFGRSAVYGLTTSIRKVSLCVREKVIWTRYGSVSNNISCSGTITDILEAITNNQELQKRWRKEKIEQLQYHNAKLQADLELEKLNAIQWKENANRWDKAYEKLRKRYNGLLEDWQLKTSIAQRIEIDNYHLRTEAAQSQKAWDREKEQLSDHIAGLRDGIDEMKITEEELLREYEQLLMLVEQCVGALAHTVPSDNQPFMSAFRMKLGYQPGLAIEGVDQDEMDAMILGSILLQRVMENTESRVWAYLNEWLCMDDAKMVLSQVDAFDKLHDTIFRVVSNNLAGKTSTGKSNGKQKAVIAATKAGQLSLRNGISLDVS
jgi:hypothetical protein